MANIKSFPNNQNVFIGAEEVMKWLHGRTSGVFAAENNAAVAAVQGEMAVTVSDGIGWLANAGKDGIVWWNDHEERNGEKLKLSVSVADSVLNRIDFVVVEWKTTDYTDLPHIRIVAGTPSSGHIEPSLINTETLRQICLARIVIPAGSTEITASMITDTRLNPAYCGIVTESAVVDTSMASAQFDELLRRVKDNLEQIMAGQIADESITVKKLSQEVKEFVSAYNLLDNSDFANVVNQRGKPEYYGTTGYSIDRWRAVANIRLTVKNGYVSVKNEGSGYNGFTQYFDPSIAPKQGDVYTAACRLHDGTILCGAVTITDGEYNTAIRMDSGTTVRFYCPTNRLIIMCAPGDELEIEWIAVYKGEYTAETLPNYRPKGYSVELAECQRYFRVVSNGDGYAGNNAYIFFPFEFRVTPTATVVELGTIRTDGSQVVPTGVTQVDVYHNSLRLTLSGTYPGSNQPANLFGANIQLSADL